MAKRLEIFAPETFPLVEPGDSLPQLILDTLQQEQIPLQQGDLLVLAQKIISKSEGRYVDLPDISPTDEALELARTCDKDPRLVQLILDESSEVLRCVPGVIIVRHRLGFVMANAGIDHSNLAGADHIAGFDHGRARAAPAGRPRPQRRGNCGKQLEAGQPAWIWP